MTKSFIYYAIRHKATGELMPQAKRDRGYSHWNPSHPEHEFRQKLGVPRLIDTRRRAARCITMWVANPNGKRSGSQNNYTGEYDDIVDFKDDGRTSDDLEVIEINLLIRDEE
jgi:hypothetical protein